jgi:hypothetical protein
MVFIAYIEVQGQSIVCQDKRYKTLTEKLKSVLTKSYLALEI